MICDYYLFFYEIFFLFCVLCTLWQQLAYPYGRAIQLHLGLLTGKNIENRDFIKIDF